MPAETMIKMFIRNRRGRPCGVLLGTKVKGRVQIGYSLCNMTLDKWNPTLGHSIAEARIGKVNKKTLPHSVAKLWTVFEDRCIRYFKVGKKTAKKRVAKVSA
jgi:hypothetical protein